MTQFRSLLEVLAAAEVEFVIIGGLAAAAHGSARLTQDIDIVYARTPGNLAKLEKALSPYAPYLRGAPPGLPFTWSVDTLRRGLNFTLTTTLGEIDLFGEVIGGGGYADLLGRTIRVELFGATCLCLDLPTLIRLKRAAGRPRDLDAIAELEALADEREGAE